MRNHVLMGLVGDLVHKFGRQVAEKIIRVHYETYRSNIRTPWDDHREEFCNAWNGMLAAVVGRLNTPEREKYDSLNTEHQQEGFRIVRSFAGAAAHQGRHDYPVARDSLADRLAITPPGARGVIQRLVEIGAIIPTQAYCPHTQPARYRWFCPIDLNPPASVTVGNGQS
jgi:hypothetical protein